MGLWYVQEVDPHTALEECGPCQRMAGHIWVPVGQRGITLMLGLSSVLLELLAAEVYVSKDSWLLVSLNHQRPVGDVTMLSHGPAHTDLGP